MLSLKPSKFNFLIPAKDGLSAAYNSRTGSLLCLGPECYELVACILEDPGRYSAASPLKLALREFGLLVDDEVDEMLLIRQRLFDWRFRRTGLDITVALTLACNLRCVYCYESSVRSSLTVTPEVEDALIEHIEKNLGESQSLTMTWYGGEPLLVPDILMRLVTRIRRIAKNKRVRLSQSIVTNGTLISQEIVDFFAECGGANIQITLDGPQGIHDKRRPFAGGGESSYKAIVHNLAHVHFGPSRIFIRCNLDKENSDACEPMLNELSKIEHQGMVIYPATVVNWGIGESCHDLTEGCYTPEEFAPVKERFERSLREHGFTASRRPFPRMGFCAAEHPRAFALGPDGAVYKCWDHVGDPDLAVTNLLFGTNRTHWAMDWVYYDPTKDPKCSGCLVLPLCMGGCHEKARRQGERSCEMWRYDLDARLSQWVGEWLKEVANRAGS